MIVVAIIGILAAVAIPYYQRYVAKSRLTSLVFPGVHAIENAISTKYAVSNTLPVAWNEVYAADADTTYFSSTWSYTALADAGYLTVTVKTGAGGGKFKALSSSVFRAVSNGANTGKLNWTYDGALAQELGF